MHHKFEGIPGDKTISDERVRKVGSNNIDLQTHKRKQVQTHMTDKVIAERLAAKVKNSKVFTIHFLFGKFYFATLDNEPITLRRFVDCELTNYVNNNRNYLVKVYIQSSQSFGAFFYKASKGRVINYIIQRLQI